MFGPILLVSTDVTLPPAVILQFYAPWFPLELTPLSLQWLRRAPRLLAL